MKAVVIESPKNMGVKEIEKPQIKDDEVLVKLCYVGFCGSDLNTYLGRNPLVKMPVVPGHEVGAIIEEVGKNVPKELTPGMVVTLNPYTNCGHCTSCRNNRFNACQNNETLGVQRYGVMAEYAAIVWTKVIPTGNISAKNAALIEPMSVGFHAVARAEVMDNSYVLVIGCGMVGLGAVIRSHLRGAIVIAADIDDEKLVLAKQVGANYTINTKTQDVHKELMEITSKNGADIVIEAVGSPETYVMAVNEVCFTGKVVCIGYAQEAVSFQTKLFVQKELDIRGSRNATPEDFRAVINSINAGGFEIDKFISSVVTPEKAEDAMKMWVENPGKIFRILVEF